MQAHRPIDILPDRSADSFAAWLGAHPGTQVVCRDRAGCYADGAARGAPQAIQVADRWHLWHNLGDAVERAVARHRRCLTAAIAPGSEPSAKGTGPELAASPGAQRRSGRIAERTRQRHAAVHQRLAEGQSLSVIAVELGLARNTVRRFARAADPGELLVNDWSSQRPRLLDEHAPYLHQRWNEGCTDAAQLWREIRDRGYTGSYTLVRDYLAPRRLGVVTPGPAPQPPKARKVTAWIMSHPDNLSRGARRQLAAILATCPDLAAVQAHVSAFADLMTQRRGWELEKWITAASSQPLLRPFADGLRRDQDAVTAGLTLPWSSGVVEGHVNRIILWNQNCQVEPRQVCRLASRTSMIGSLVARAGGSSCRGAGPAGVGVSASRSSRRLRAAPPSSTAACSSSVSGIIACIFCRFSLAWRSCARPESFGV